MEDTDKPLFFCIQDETHDVNKCDWIVFFLSDWHIYCISIMDHKVYIIHEQVRKYYVLQYLCAMRNNIYCHD